MARMRPVLRGAGGARLRRTYRFELSDDGVSRKRGSITLVGATVESVDLPPAPPGSPETLS